MQLLLPVLISCNLVQLNTGSKNFCWRIGLLKPRAVMLMWVASDMKHSVSPGPATPGPVGTPLPHNPGPITHIKQVYSTYFTINPFPQHGCCRI